MHNWSFIKLKYPYIFFKIFIFVNSSGILHPVLEQNIKQLESTRTNYHSHKKTYHDQKEIFSAPDTNTKTNRAPNKLIHHRYLPPFRWG